MILTAPPSKKTALRHVPHHVDNRFDERPEIVYCCEWLRMLLSLPCFSTDAALLWADQQESDIHINFARALIVFFSAWKESGAYPPERVSSVLHAFEHAMTLIAAKLSDPRSLLPVLVNDEVCGRLATLLLSVAGNGPGQGSTRFSERVSTADITKRIMAGLTQAAQ